MRYDLTTIYNLTIAGINAVSLGLGLVVYRNYRGYITRPARMWLGLLVFSDFTAFLGFIARTTEHETPPARFVLVTLWSLANVYVMIYSLIRQNETIDRLRLIVWAIQNPDRISRMMLLLEDEQTIENRRNRIREKQRTQAGRASGPVTRDPSDP